MSERWVPVLAAIVGVLGGMGGAYVGGSVANEGQQQRFEEQRATELEDLRRDTYVEYLRKVDALVVLTFQTQPRPAQKEIGNAQAEARSARAQVLLVSSTAVRRAADGLMRTLINGDEDAYEDAREAFIVAAESQITNTES